DMTSLRLAALALFLAAGVARAQSGTILLSEILGSWQGDDQAQFVELAVSQDNGGGIAGARLTFDGPSGAAAPQQTVTFTAGVPNGAAGSRILIATNHLQQLANVTADFILPPGLIDSAGGRICYVLPSQSGTPQQVDCVAWGTYAGATGGFGRPTRFTPDDR